MVELFPNPNPVSNEPKANFSNLSLRIAYSNISKAVLQRNFVYGLPSLLSYAS